MQLFGIIPYMLLIWFFLRKGGCVLVPSTLIREPSEVSIEPGVGPNIWAYSPRRPRAALYPRTRVLSHLNHEGFYRLYFTLLFLYIPFSSLSTFIFSLSNPSLSCFLLSFPTYVSQISPSTPSYFSPYFSLLLLLSFLCCSLLHNLSHSISLLSSLRSTFSPFFSLPLLVFPCNFTLYVSF